MILVQKNLYAHVFMNRFKSDTDKLCKANDDLTGAFEGFNEGTPKANHFMFQLSIKDDMSQFSAYINNNLPGTGVVRLGDIDLDGYQDFSITAAEGDKDPKTYYFKNSDCTDEVKKKMNPNNDNINFEKCRYFKRATDMSLIENSNTYSSSFFDFHELGYSLVLL